MPEGEPEQKRRLRVTLPQRGYDLLGVIAEQIPGAKTPEQAAERLILERLLMLFPDDPTLLQLEKDSKGMDNGAGYAPPDQTMDYSSR